MSTVNILCPNGRRFNIKVSPNDTVMQVLEKVCIKGKFSANEYDLRHQKKILDVTVPFRYANIPNLAKLEMVRLSRPEEKVKYILLCSGLSKVKSDGNQTLQPVCIYMRREIIGQPWLQHLSLKSLGLTSGKAVISCPQTKEKPALDASVSSKDDERERTVSETPQPSAESLEIATEITDETQRAADSHRRTPAEDMDTTETQARKDGTNGQRDRSQEEPMETEEVQMKSEVVASGQSNKEDDFKQSPPGAVPKATTQNESSAAGRSEVPMETLSSNETSSVDSFLQSHGASGASLDKRTRERIALLMKKEEEMMKEMNEVADQLRAQQVATATNHPNLPTLPEQEIKFPGTQQEIERKEKHRQQAETEDLSKPCDRKVLVFDASDTLPSSEVFQDLPDSFFDTTAEDIRRLLSDLKNRQSSDRPLETKAMRDSKKQKQMAKYSKATVRIHFPDHNIVQVFFRPKEKVEALYQFVEESLNDKGAFYLYTTPPKTILKNKMQTLFEANLFPTAKVYFGSDSTQDQYLSEGTLERKYTEAVARSSVRETSTPSQSKRKPASQSRNTSSSSNSKGQVPKWFKLGKS
ncbi:putative tether containing UBX domain for GLUT4-like [Apostichopus japonicus]|uniref:Putative tether containing UBX domain for GLUT4-like n=1 Tax=Stichopus japonicus TaxID=307972 RepID=A0A2G8L116_STIJA|nr:putative tether containing UBX domain for GLUT4-like [Apostichopus japonicus]